MSCAVRCLDVYRNWVCITVQEYKRQILCSSYHITHSLTNSSPMQYEWLPTVFGALAYLYHDIGALSLFYTRQWKTKYNKHRKQTNKQKSLTTCLFLPYGQQK